MRLYEFFKLIKSMEYNDFLEYENYCISKNKNSYTIDILEGDKIIKTVYANTQELLTVEFLKNELGLIICNNNILNI